ncbi:hypothetical protein JB92DRAFT_3312587 [Gautieria morchelliformis]|nr:hypothetical protein JB92DRAFT_3312587 [Gautieria morchelliformis]
MSSPCPACGKPYVAERRQLRLGADEPEVEVKCRCSTGVSKAQILMAITSGDLLSTKVTAERRIVPSDAIVLRPVTLSLEDLSDHGGSTTEYEIRIEKSISKLIYSSVKSQVIECIEYGVPTSVKVGGNVVSSRLRLRSDEIATLKYTESQVVLCPGMTLCKSREVAYLQHTLPDLMAPRHTDQSYKCVIKTKRVYYNDWVMRCDYHELSDTYMSELELLGDVPPSRAIISAALKWIHTSFGHASSLSRYIPQRLVLECRLACPQVLDVLVPPKEANVFRWKADGEQCWVIGCGYIWYTCRPDARLTVFAWEASMAHTSFDIDCVTIVRAEQMIDGSLVYIDVLCRNGISATPLRRHVPGLMQLASFEFRPRLVVRPEYATLEEARNTLGSVASALGFEVIYRDTDSVFLTKVSRHHITVDNYLNTLHLHTPSGNLRQEIKGLAPVRKDRPKVAQVLVSELYVASTKLACFVVRCRLAQVDNYLNTLHYPNDPSKGIKLTPIHRVVRFEGGKAPLKRNRSSPAEEKPRALYLYGAGGEGKSATINTILAHLPGAVHPLSRDVR